VKIHPFSSTANNTVGERILRADRGNITRPTVNEVYEYRAHVDSSIRKLIETTQSQEILDLMILGINHEQQHQELLLTDIKYILGANPLFPVYDARNTFFESVNDRSGWINMKEGLYEIGHTGSDFHFDNELGRHKVYLPEYEISEQLVTNQEFLEFIEDGGYTNFNCWLDEGGALDKGEQHQQPSLLA
jgi:formylglycine-generating enzyme required for sulfatase activity